MSKDSFRVSTGAKRIEVNDAGECITLNLGDQSFLPRLSAVIDAFNARMPEYEAHAKELDAMTVETEQDNFNKLKDMAQYNEKIHRELMSEIDGVFQDEVCRKVFGAIVPPMDMFADFFKQLAPYIEKYGRERAEKISKYSPNRTGNA